MPVILIPLQTIRSACLAPSIGGVARMIVLPPGAHVWLACGYTDMHKGMDGLAMLAQQVLAEDPFSGALFAFRGKLRIPVDRDHRFRLIAITDSGDPDHAFRWIAIIGSGDPDHSGDDGADRPPLTVFNRG
jgi:hypothetical protein